LCPLGALAQPRDEDGAPEDPRARARRIAAAPELSESEKTLIKRPDRKRPDDPVCIDVFGQPLCLGGRMQIRARAEIDRLNDFDYEDLDDFGVIEDRVRGDTPIEDRVRGEITLTVNSSYRVSDNIFVYLEGRVGARARLYMEHGREDVEWVFERDETWIFLGNLFGSNFSLQAGRQKFFDNREWFWDQDLDSVRLQYDRESFYAYVGVAQELFGTQDGEGTHPEDEDVLRILFAANYEWSRKNIVGIYALHHYDHSSRILFSEADDVPDITGSRTCTEFDVAPPFFNPPVPDDISGCLRSRDDDESDATLTWVGASAQGRIKSAAGSFHYWANVAGVFGDETFFDITGDRTLRRLLPERKNHHNVRGYGLDVLGTFEAKLPFKPRFTLGYAFGSGGDDLSKEKDTGFRQTGIQDNTDKWLGVDAFRYYGELTNFELSNIHIFTAALGFPLLRKSSVEFIYHHYLQHHRSEYIRDWRPSRDPNGKDRGNNGMDRDLGWELDVVLGLEEWESFEVELVGAVFQAGEAFDVRPPSLQVNDKANELSWMGIAQFRFNF
jgi:hypothetical protein